jgi:cytochrome c-type biogenesis protein CcmH
VTAFLMLAVLMTAAALAFILPTLLEKQKTSDSQTQRDQVNLAVLRDQLRELEVDLASGTIDADAYDSARRELEQRVAEDVKPNPPVPEPTSSGFARAISVGLAVMIGATVLYACLGKPAGLDPAQVTATSESPREFDPKDPNAAIEQLAQLLKTQPENTEGWTMLARSLNAMGRYADASTAYKNLTMLVPKDAQLLTEYAGSLAMAQGESLQGEPEKILARALAAEPRNTKALSLSGSAAFERGDYDAAITLWEKVVALAPADSEIVQVANDNIKEARAAAAAGNQPTLAEAPVALREIAQPVVEKSSMTATTRSTQVAGTVELDPALRSELKDTDTVFVFARASEGPRFPLAVLRKQVKDLPFSFVLDDSMSMMPGASLSGFSSLVVGARISKSGNATPGVGDLEGSVSSVQPGANDVKIRISSRRSK